MRTLTDERSRHAPLHGAHVVAVAAMSHGVASRVLRQMDVDAIALRKAADEIVSRHSMA